ncbi:MAG: M18 family aminopeptidase [Olsenella sp.]|nr:M18 family aminopeptidase [Olsenella sp.]
MECGREVSRELVEFIGRCPSAFHTVSTARVLLDEAGATYLPEGSEWHLEPGGMYYTVRNNSSIICWRVGAALDDYHFQVAAAHGDSPSYRVKAVPELEGPGEYLRINVEGYGGMIDYSWLDRPLGVAGRVLVETPWGVASRLVHIDRDVLLIPSLCIHMNREVNNGFSFNRQVDLCPLFSAGSLSRGDFDRMIAEELGVGEDAVLARDLFLVNRERGRVWGQAGEFVSSGRLDDLQCAFAALKAFLASTNEGDVSVCAIFDNEEVGSGTKQGALSTFLRDVLVRVSAGLGMSDEDHLRAVAKSFLVSCDNAHAVHPNHPEKTDDANRAWLNGGIVVKESANQHYTTDAFSSAVFKAICARAGVPVQPFANRSDSPGGSTLGNLSNTQVSVHAIDIGLPQLAMHSSYETAGVADTAYAIRALTAFFDTTVRIDGADGAAL